MFLDVPAVWDKSSSRIFHGEDVLPTERPYQVRLLAALKCGGSLIKTDWVLTAAHCLMADKTCQDDSLEGAIVITAGIVDLETLPDRPEELQDSTVKPPVLNQNVFFPSFQDWIDECKSQKMRGYGTSTYVNSDRNLVLRHKLICIELAVLRNLPYLQTWH